MNKNKAIPGIVVAIVAILLYLNTMHHGYVLDDITIISQNHLVQQGIGGIPELLKTSYWFGYNGSKDLGYRPLSLVMFAIEWQISPSNPLINHLVNILLYGATGIMLFITLRQLFENTNKRKEKVSESKPPSFSFSQFLTIPFIASLLFIAHPIHTEVVDNIKSRDEMLSFFFSLLTIFFMLKYVRENRVKNLLLSLLSFFLALVSKENSITIIAVIPLIIYFFTDTPLKNNLKTTACIAALIAGYIVLRLMLPEGFTFRKGMPVTDNTLLSAPDIFMKLATAVMLLGKYLLLLLFPHPLISDYSYHHIEIIGWSDWRAIASLLIYLALIIYSIKEVKKKNLYSFSILFYLITFSIVSNIFFAVGATVAERFLYMPSLGFCLAIAVLILKRQRTPTSGRINESVGGPQLSFVNSDLFRYSLVALIFFLYSFKTISRNSYWKDNFTLFSEDIKAAPNSCKLNYYYAVSLLDRVNANANLSPIDRELAINEAVERLNKALAITKDFVEAYEEMGYAYYLKADFATAIDYYEKADSYHSRTPSLFNNYGVALSELRQYDKAIVMLQKAIAINRDYPEALNNLGTCFNSMGRYAEAVPYFKKAIDLKPQYEAAYKNIARSYANLKEYDTAIGYLKTAAELIPDDADVYLYLGLSYKYKGDLENAEKYLQQSDRLKKKYEKSR